MGTFHKETKHGEIDRCVLLPGGIRPEPDI